MRIYLTGFMGSGKSTVGQSLARRLGWEFVDLDAEIEAAARMGVREIFEREGDGGFRERERQALEKTLEKGPSVVATGGGTMTREENREIIRRGGVSVWLHPPFASIVSRIGALGKEDRPLFRDEAQAFALYRERLPAYRSADLRVDVAPGEESEEVAARIELLLRERGCDI